MSLCECGCGQETRLASHTMSARGWVRGEFGIVTSHVSSINIGRAWRDVLPEDHEPLRVIEGGKGQVA
jgi:hypothetical protein